MRFARPSIATAMFLAIAHLSANAQAGAIESCTENYDATNDVLIQACNDVLSSKSLTRTERVKALFSRAYAYRDKADSDKVFPDLAIRDLDEVTAIDRTNSLAYQVRGDIFFWRDQNDRAIEQYSEGLKLSPKSTELLTGRAMSYKRKNNLDAALADYDRILARDPKRPYSLWSRAEVYEAKGDLPKAIQDFDQAVEFAKESDSTTASIRKYRGEFHVRHNNLEGALADFDKVIALNVEHSDPPYWERGRVRLTLKDYPGAAEDFAVVNKKYPNFSLAYRLRASSLGEMGKHAEAIEAVSKAISLAPDDHWAHNIRCWERAVIGEGLALALADCNEALRLQADHWYSLDSRGFVHLKLGKVKEALADYERASVLAPKEASPLYGRGLAKKKLGDRTGGDADIAAARSLEPGIVEFYAKAGYRSEP